MSKFKYQPLEDLTFDVITREEILILIWSAASENNPSVEQQPFYCVISLLINLYSFREGYPRAASLFQEWPHGHIWRSCDCMSCTFTFSICIYPACPGHSTFTSLVMNFLLHLKTWISKGMELVLSFRSCYRNKTIPNGHCKQYHFCPTLNMNRDNSTHWAWLLGRNICWWWESEMVFVLFVSRLVGLLLITVVFLGDLNLMWEVCIL